jgi:hypothetical protein
MRYRLAIPLSFATSTLCFATTLPPFAGYCNLLDRVASVAASQTQTGEIALDVLERIALGQAGEGSPEAGNAVGLKANQLKDPAFRKSVDVHSERSERLVFLQQWASSKTSNNPTWEMILLFKLGEPLK